jgi:hypothetical protein
MILGIGGCGKTKPVSLGKIVLSADGTKAYIADYNLQGVRIVDVHDPENPALLGSVSAYIDNALTHINIVLSPDGKQVFVSGHNSEVFGWGGLAVFDVQNDTSPKLLKVHLPENKKGYKFPLAISNNGKTLYAAKTDGNLTFIDVTDTANPTIRKELDESLYGACILHPDGAKVYCGQYIIEADATEHVVRGNNLSSDQARRFSSDGSKMFGVSFLDFLVHKGYIQSYDMTDPDAPTRIGEYAENKATYNDLAVSPDDAILYVTDDSGLHIFEINATGGIIHKSFEAHSQAKGIALSADGHTAYVACSGTEGLKILDVRDLDNVKLLGTYK